MFVCFFAIDLFALLLLVCLFGFVVRLASSAVDMLLVVMVMVVTAVVGVGVGDGCFVGIVDGSCVVFGVVSSGDCSSLLYCCFCCCCCYCC